MRKRAVVVTILIVVVAAFVWAFYPRTSGDLRPVSVAEGRKLLAEVQKGVKDNHAKIKNGCGRVRVSELSSFPKSPNFERTTTCEASFEGDNYKVRVVEQQTRSKQPLTERLKQLGKPGAGKSTPARSSMPYPSYRLTLDAIYSGDGKTITRYVPKKKQALIFGRVSLQAFEARGRLRAVIVGNGSSYWNFTAGEESNVPSPDYKIVRSEPVVLGRQRLGNDDCIVIEQNVTYSSRSRGFAVTRRFVFWVCPRKGYTTLKTNVWERKPVGNEHKEILVSVGSATVREYRPGVWGMAKLVVDNYNVRDDGQTYKLRQNLITFDPDYQLNVPKSKLDLKLKLPKGTDVVDQVKGEDYVVK